MSCMIAKLEDDNPEFALYCMYIYRGEFYSSEPRKKLPNEFIRASTLRSAGKALLQIDEYNQS
jgi:hypothetical protein